VGDITRGDQAGLRIALVAGVGRGQTLLSAFEAALFECGAANFNLIPLSSVIPPKTLLSPAHRFCPDGDRHGDRLYVVKADARSDRPGACVGAAIGWYQWGDGRGVFVEHEMVGTSEAETERALRALVHDSLRDLCAHRGVDFADAAMGSRCAIARVADRATCALVLAIYGAEPWDHR
jgi:arginine decarboxylase